MYLITILYTYIDIDSMTKYNYDSVKFLWTFLLQLTP